MNKKLLLIPLLLTMLATSCGKSNTPSGADDGIIIMNSFEDMSQLSLMKFPFPKHSDRGRFDLSDEHVTHGEKSLKYSNDHGSFVEVCHYFTNLAEDGIQVNNIKSIELDIFNASEFDTTCSLMIYTGKDMSTLLTENYTLKANESTHLVFNLSKVALEFNYEEIRCSSLKLYTLNTNYNAGIGYTFYIDNWRAVLGAEYTEEDLEYKPVLDDIVAQIDTLPLADNITFDYEEILKGIANSISVLPDLYRRAVPNISKYKECLDAYYSYACAQSVIDFDGNTFLKLDEFYGSSQLTPDTDTKADIFYSEELWPNEPTKRGGTKIVFSGGTDNKFIYNSEVNLNDFDFIHFRIYNASPNKIRIWFSYPSQISLDLKAGEVKEAKFSSKLLANQFYWAILHLRGESDDSLINSSGSVIFDEVYVTGRSQETRKAQLIEALNDLPTLDTLQTEDDYIKNITLIEVAKTLKEDVVDKTGIDSDKLDLVDELVKKVEEAGYGIAYNAYFDTMRRADYGGDFSSECALKNDEFGYVNTADIEYCPPHSTDPNKHEQGFTFSNATNISGNYGGFVIYIYNPTVHTFSISVRDTSWKWDQTQPYWTNMDVLPGWNKVEIKLEVITASDDKKVMILGNDNSLNLDWKGQWLFSSLVGVPRKL